MRPASDGKQTTEAAPLSALDADAVENVYVFVSDALRYDFLPARVAERGLTCKTTAHALVTPQSLPTMFSGQLPPRHGVKWFDHAVDDDLTTLFDAEWADTGYSELVWHGDALRKTLGDPSVTDVTTATPPFVVCEHDNGGHAPYAGHEDERPSETLGRVTSRDDLVTLYRRTVAESVDRFLHRVEILRDRGLLDETLVVFTADHGELLGEYGGFAGHGLPMTPELVYVPTVFSHPSLPTDETSDSLVQHVDLYPTIVEVLTGTTPTCDGIPLRTERGGDRSSFVQGSIHPPQRFRDTFLDPGYDSVGLWTDDGGHVFVENPRAVRTVTALYEATSSAYTAALNSHRNRALVIATTLNHYLRDHHEYGSPALETEAAREWLDALDTSDRESVDRELSEETERHLKQLGYR